MTIFIRSSDSKYLQIRNILAQNLLWVQIFQFFCCSIFTYFEKFFFLLHRKSNLTFFFAFMWKIVSVCRMRFYLPNKVKNISFNFWYFWSWISLDLKRYLAVEIFSWGINMFILAPFYFFDPSSFGKSLKTLFQISHKSQ